MVRGKIIISLSVLFFLSACTLTAEIQKTLLALQEEAPFNAELSSNAPSVGNVGLIPVTFTFSESLVDFDANDVVVTNGTVSNFQCMGAVCTAEVAPSGEGFVTIGLAGQPLTTESGKVVTPTLERVFTFDQTAPTVVVSSIAAPLTDEATILLNIVFSEPVTELTVDDFVVVNGIVTLLSGVGGTYTASLVAIGPGAVEVTLPLGAAKDMAGNVSFASNTLSLIYDPFAPNPSLSTTAPTTNNLASIPISVSFVSAVTDFDVGDLTLQNATVTGFAGAGDSYTFNLIPIASGPVSVSVGAGSVHNSLGTPNISSSVLNFEIDYEAPAVMLAGPLPALGSVQSTLEWSVNYSGANSVSLSGADVSLVGTDTAGCVVAVSGTGTTTRSVFVTGCSGNGTVGIFVNSGTAEDAVGNLAPMVGPSSYATIDNTGPSLSITTPSPLHGRSTTSFVWQVNYSDANIVSLSPSDISLQGAISGCSISVSGTGKISRTVTVTGCAGEGTLGISIAAGTAQDSLGNLAAAAGPSVVVALDNTAPTLVLGSPTPALGNSSTEFKWEVTYSGSDSISLDVSDLLLSGTAASSCATKNVQTTSATVRTVVISGCTSDGTLALSITAGTAQDLAGNLSAGAGPSSAVAVNNSVLTSVLSSIAGTHNKLSTIPVAVVFADSVTGFSSGELTLTNATIANFSGSGKNYSFDLIPTGDGEVGVQIPASVAENSFGTQNEISNYLSFQVDRVAPTVNIGAPALLLGNSSATFAWSVLYTGADSVTLSEADITLNGTSADCLVAVTGSGVSARTVSVSGCTGSGALSISIAANTAQDLAGNQASAAGPSSSVTVDNLAPSLVLSASSPVMGNSATDFIWDLTYSGADSITLGSGDIVLNGTNAGCSKSLTGSGNTRTVTVSGCTGNGTLTISVVAGTASDLAGNMTAAAGPSTAVTVDNTAPTLTIGLPSPVLGKSTTQFQWVATYGGADTISLSAADVTLNGAVAGCLKSVSGMGATRTITVEGCTGNGSLTISLAANSALDFASNQAPAVGPSSAVTVDNTGPGLSISSPSPVLGRVTTTFAFTLSYSDAAAITLNSSDVTLTGTATTDCSVGISGTGLSARTVAVSGCSGDGTVGIAVAANTATDSLGNTSPAASSMSSAVVDNTAPTLLIGAPTPTLGKSTTNFAWVVTYSGADTITLAAANVTLAGATAGCTKSVTGSGTTRTVTVSGCTGNGNLNISIAANSASDSVGNQALAAGPSADVTVDNTAPTLSIGAPTPTIGKSSTTFTWDITYSNADTISLSSANVTLSGATAGCSKNVSGSMAVRTVSVTGCTGNGTLTISIAANTAQDSAGNQASSTGPSASVTIDNTSPTLSIGLPTPTIGKSSTSFSWDVTYTGADTITLSTSDITLNGATTGCSKSISGAGSVRTVTVTGCTGDGSLTVSVVANTAQDSAGNQALTAGPSTAVMVDNSGPVMSISAPSPTSGKISTSFAFTATYSDASTVTLTNLDVTLTGTATAGCSVNVTGSGLSTRTISVSGCTGDGTVGVSVAAGTATDSLGNSSLSASSASSATVDNIAPTLSISSPTPVLGRSTTSFAWVVTYSGADTITLAAANVTLAGATTGCAKSVTGSGATRTITVSGCTGNGNLNVSIASNSASDNAGNQALAAGPSADVTVDNLAPTLSIGAPTPTVGKSTTIFAWDITYTGADTITLTAANITLGGVTTGCAKSVAGSGSTRTVTVTGCTGNGSLNFSVVTGTATDNAGNSASSSGSSSSVTVDNTAPTVAITYPAANYQMADGGHAAFYASGTCSDNTRTITFTPAATSTVTCSSGNWSATFDLTAETGDTVTILASHADAAGNVGTNSRLFYMPPKYYKVKEIYSASEAFAALRSDGSIVAWGHSLYGGAAPASVTGANAGVIKVYSSSTSSKVFIALKSDGSVVVWGDSSYGEDLPPTSVTDANSKVVDIFPKTRAIAALKSDGSVVAWGEPTYGGVAPASVTDSNSGVVKIFSTSNAFAALKSDGSVVAWGSSGSASAPASVTAANSKVTKIYSTSGAFAALKSDGSVVTWGDSSYGGSAPAGVTNPNSKVVAIYSTGSAFAALKSDGSVVAWGDSAEGGNAPVSVTAVNSKVAAIYSTNSAFAALKSDGSVVAWGYQSDVSAPASVTAANSRVKNIFSNTFSFVALKYDGSVVVWGWSSYGGNAPSSVTAANSGVVDIVSNFHGHAALKSDGSVVSWGYTPTGNAPASVTSPNSGVVKIVGVSGGGAFAALKYDGTVVTWGGGAAGNISSVAAKLAGTKASVMDVTGNLQAFTALKSDGSVVTWGVGSNGGAAPSSVTSAGSAVSKVVGSGLAFAALKSDGSVVAWGNSSYGGTAPSGVTDPNSKVGDVVSTDAAFAALKSDGSILAWGDGSYGGSAPSGVTDANSGVKKIARTAGAFAALKSDGSVVSWGDSTYGGSAPTSVTNANSGVKEIYSTATAFAALKTDGSVVAWGSSVYGGNAPSSVTTASSGVAEIFSTDYAFAARKTDGSIVTWGYVDYGGVAPSSVTAANSDVASVVRGIMAFAALKSDGSVISWGLNGAIDAPTEVSAAGSDVKSIYASSTDFVTLKSSGAIVAWGTGTGASAPTSVTSAGAHVKKVYAVEDAFAALNSEGSIVAWGDSSAGGSAPSSVTSSGSGVIKVYNTSKAFAALKSDGGVIAWGHSGYGGTAVSLPFKD